MTLVLCDDHAMFLEALAAALTAWHHDVVGLTTDPALLPALVAERRPDGCLLDVRLGDTSGIELAAQVRAASPGTVVVLLTGAREPEVDAAFDRGLVDGLVSKSCDAVVLDRAVRRALAGERVLEGWAWRPTPSPSASTRLLALLTDREREVLLMIAQGASTSAMSAALGVSTNTVRTHVQSVLQKLQVHHRTKAARLAVELGLVAAAS
jgi:two-component system, NarL family, nitrate/nitrite response regulator NarL